jgi:hypothetical protein
VQGATGAGKGGSDPDRFERWLAELRVDDDAKARVRRHWLRTAAEEDASLAGVLLDLAERHVPVGLLTAAGRRHHGEVAVVGADFVALRTGRERHVLMPFGTLVSVRPAADATAPVGDREPGSALELVDVLIGLAAERLDAAFLLASGDRLTGQVRSVGQDLLVVRTEGSAAPTVYVALDAVVEVALDGPGLSP